MTNTGSSYGDEGRQIEERGKERRVIGRLVRMMAYCEGVKERWLQCQHDTERVSFRKTALESHWSHTCVGVLLTSRGLSNHCLPPQSTEIVSVSRSFKDLLPTDHWSGSCQGYRAGRLSCVRVTHLSVSDSSPHPPYERERGCEVSRLPEVMSRAREHTTSFPRFLSPISFNSLSSFPPSCACCVFLFLFFSKSCTDACGDICVMTRGRSWCETHFIGFKTNNVSLMCL